MPTTPTPSPAPEQRGDRDAEERHRRRDEERGQGAGDMLLGAGKKKPGDPDLERGEGEQGIHFPAYSTETAPGNHDGHQDDRSNGGARENEHFR